MEAKSALSLVANSIGSRERDGEYHLPHVQTKSVPLFDNRL
jgi:hypothetical protein